MNWEMEQMSYSQNCEIAMPKDGNAIMEATGKQAMYVAERGETS
jgi:hypothetical protein